MSSIQILVERQFSRKQRKNQRLPSLFLMTDADRGPDVFRAIRGLRSGAGVVLRHYRSPKRARLAKRLSRYCRARGLVFLVAGDADLARTVGAHGLHLPTWALRNSDRDTNAKIGRDWILTASVHNYPELGSALRFGVSAIILSPIFATPSHPDRKAMGPLTAARIARLSSVPVIALGGMSKRTVPRLRHCGLNGVAGVSLS